MSVELNNDLLMVAPLIVALLGLTAAVLVDKFIRKERKRLLLIIVALIFSMVLNTYVEYRLQLLEKASPWRTVVSIYGFAIRPFILVLYFLVVGKRNKYYYIAFALASINMLVHLTAFFSPIAFQITDENHFVRGPLNYINPIVSGILLVQLLFLSVRECYKVRKAETLLPLLNVIIVVISIVVDMTSKDVFPTSFLTGSMVICSIIYYIWLHLRFVREHEQALMEENRNRLILSQIQPHFIYNTLFSIQAIEGNPEETKKAINDFANYIRGNLAALDGKELISLKSEIEYVKDYVLLQQRRFPDKFDVIYDLKDENFSVPPLSVQILVENAIKHGILVQRKFGTITVQTRQENNFHVINVIDDGVGFDVSILKDSNRVGLRAVRNRLEYHLNGTLSIQSEPGKGTKVTIKIPCVVPLRKRIIDSIVDAPKRMRRRSHNENNDR